jgi:hypothetical protein
MFFNECTKNIRKQVTFGISQEEKKLALKVKSKIK